MNDVNPVLIIGAIIISYFLGTFPSALIVAKRGGVDVTAAGSGNPGTSNVVRLLGWKYGLVVFLADVLKGSASVAIAWLSLHRPNFPSSSGSSIRLGRTPSGNVLARASTLSKRHEPCTPPCLPPLT